MKIQIGRIGENIVCNRDFSEVKDTGEVAHILMELEITKGMLLELWEELHEKE